MSILSKSFIFIFVFTYTIVVSFAMAMTCSNLTKMPQIEIEFAGLQKIHRNNSAVFVPVELNKLLPYRNALLELANTNFNTRQNRKHPNDQTMQALPSQSEFHNLMMRYMNATFEVHWYFKLKGSKGFSRMIIQKRFLDEGKHIYTFAVTDPGEKLDLSDWNSPPGPSKSEVFYLNPNNDRYLQSELDRQAWERQSFSTQLQKIKISLLHSWIEDTNSEEKPNWIRALPELWGSPEITDLFAKFHKVSIDLPSGMVHLRADQQPLSYHETKMLKAIDFLIQNHLKFTDGIRPWDYNPPEKPPKQNVFGLFDALKQAGVTYSETGDWVKVGPNDEPPPTQNSK